MLSKISGFFRDDTGALSSTRLCFVTGLFTTLGLWAYASFEAKTMAPIQPSALGLVATLMAGKVGQSITENQK
jgi:hypothetical protein